jgi:phage shock protein PspC (stress-responsive transcriptional regulator)
MSDSDELEKLGDLHRRGVLSDEEFARAKARVLGAVPGGGEAPSASGFLQSLRRSRHDRWLGGVCGGIAQATGAPSWAWRLLFAVLLVCAGTGVLLYLLLWIFMPEEARQPLGPSAAAPRG